MAINSAKDVLGRANGSGLDIEGAGSSLSKDLETIFKEGCNKAVPNGGFAYGFYTDKQSSLFADGVSPISTNAAENLAY